MGGVARERPGGGERFLLRFEAPPTGPVASCTGRSREPDMRLPRDVSGGELIAGLEKVEDMS